MNRRAALVAVCVLGVLATCAEGLDLESYPRVQEARQLYSGEILQLFRHASVSYPPQHLYLRAFKEERMLEVWAASSSDSIYRHVADFPFTGFSGELGPKAEEGDRQIPEGFYYIEDFNPVSLYAYFALRISYPNKADRERSRAAKLGGKICIHGHYISTGCIVIGNEGVSKLFLMALDAYNQGEKRIPVHIFPCRLHYLLAGNHAELDSLSQDNAVLRQFWENLQQGHDRFEFTARVPSVWIDERGVYRFKDASDRGTGVH